MKRELSMQEEEIAEKIFSQLIGLNYEQAVFILKEVTSVLKERARIEEGTLWPQQECD